jgi:hypothetical protein
MKEQFVPYEIALKLKEKGFDAGCFGFYKSNGEYEDYHYYRNGKYYLCNNKTISKLLDGENIDQKAIAPLWDQIIEWLREEHKLIILVLPQVQSICDSEPLYFMAIEKIIIGDSFKEVFNSSNITTLLHYETYQEARQTAIEHALTLI